MNNLKEVLNNKFKNEKVETSANGFEAVFSAVTQLKKKKRRRAIILYSTLAIFVGTSVFVGNNLYNNRNIENPITNKSPKKEIVKTDNADRYTSDKYANDELNSDALAKDNSTIINLDNLSNKNVNKIPEPIINDSKANKNFANKPADKIKDIHQANNYNNNQDAVYLKENAEKYVALDHDFNIDPTKSFSTINYIQTEYDMNLLANDEDIVIPTIERKKDIESKYYGELELVLSTGLVDGDMLNPLSMNTQVNNTYKLANKRTYGYGLDMRYLYRISKHGALYSGLGYSKSIQNVDLTREYIEHTTIYNTRTAVVYDPGLGAYKTIVINDTIENDVARKDQNTVTNDFTTLSIPLGYEFRIPVNKVIFAMRVGTALNIYQRNNYHTKSENQMIPVKNSEQNNMSLQGVNLGAGILRPIGKGYYFKAELDYMNSFQTNPSRYNVGIGIRKSF